MNKKISFPITFVIVIVLLVAIINGLRIMNRKYDYVVSPWTGFCNGFSAVFLLMPLIFIIRAIYNFVTSGGNKEKTKTAIKSVIYALLVSVIWFLVKGLGALLAWV